MDRISLADCPRCGANQSVLCGFVFGTITEDADEFKTGDRVEVLQEAICDTCKANVVNMISLKDQEL